MTQSYDRSFDLGVHGERVLLGGRMTFSLVCNAEAVGADAAMSIRDGAMARLEEAVE